jgi:hypothetical protein
MALTKVGAGVLNIDDLYGFRNRIINGDMRIAQRGTAAVTAADSFPVDRFFVPNTSDAAFSAQQDSSAPVGFKNSIKFTTTTADASLTGSQSARVEHNIEGLNVGDLEWGTANAKTVTLSFWVRSSLTGSFGGVLTNQANNRVYPFSYPISVADTWEYKTITIPGDTTGTWRADNGLSIRVCFALGAGPDRSGTANAWASANLRSVTGAVSVIGTLNATFYITGVQLEKGTVATPFERRPFGTELALCQRYYQQFDSADGGSSGAGFAGVCASTAVAVVTGTYLVEMRVAPTITFNNININFGGALSTITALSSFASKRTLGADVTVTGTPLTVGRAAVMQFTGGASISNRIAFSSEL